MARLLFLLAFLFSVGVAQNVGVNTSTPDPSAALDVESSDKGFLPPRLTTAERDAIASPASGLIVFNTTTNCLNFYNGTKWISTCVDAPPCVEPPAPAAGSNNPVCEGQTINLTASPVGGATYIWSGPNSFYSTSQNPSIANATPVMDGTYTVRSWIAGCYSAESDTTVTIAPDPWTQMTDFPGTARTNSAIFAINDSLFVGSGNVSCPSVSVNDLWCYDATSDNWAARTAHPGATRYFVTGWAQDGKGYFAGGTNVACNDEFVGVFEYDPPTASWVTKGTGVANGSKRAIFAAVTIGSTTWAGLGRRLSACNQFADFYSYDGGTDTWTTTTAFPGTKRGNPVYFEINGKAYVGIGARWICNDANLSDWYEFDPATTTWTQKADYPGSPGSLNVWWAIGNYGYVVDDTDGTIYRYDAAANIWEAQPCPYPGDFTESARTAVINGSAYVVHTTGSKDVWQFTP